MPNGPSYGFEKPPDPFNTPEANISIRLARLEEGMVSKNQIITGLIAIVASLIVAATSLIVALVK